MGTMVWHNDNVYKGPWKENKVHGNGKYTEGTDVFEGEY